MHWCARSSEGSGSVYSSIGSEGGEDRESSFRNCATEESKSPFSTSRVFAPGLGSCLATTANCSSSTATSVLPAGGAAAGEGGGGGWRHNAPGGGATR